MPNLPSLNALRAFDYAAKYESVTQAADALHVTHGAVSRQLKQLETQLGVALFNRQGRQLTLTPAGEQLHASTQTAFAELEKGCATIQHSERERPFVLKCPGSFLARWFIPRLSQLERDCPQLDLHLSASDTAAWPLNPGVDAWLCYARPPWPDDAEVVALMAERIGPVMRAELAQQVDIDDPASVQSQVLLHTASRSQAWQEWFRWQGIAAEPPVGQQFEHLNYMLEAAMVGLGVAIAPETLVRDDIANGRLVAPWGFVETDAQLTLWFASGGMRPSGEDLLHWLKQQLQA